MSATVLQCAKWRFSGLNQQNFCIYWPSGYIYLYKSPTHTGIICAKTLEPNISSLAPLKVHKIENFFGSEFEFYTISLLVMLKY